MRNLRPVMQVLVTIAITDSALYPMLWQEHYLDAQRSSGTLGATMTDCLNGRVQYATKG
jgi:hypothetical protein